MRKITFLILLASLSSFGVFGQGDTLSVLFLGNSYTGANNLPQITQSLATSAGNTLLISSNTPGGHTMEGHSMNAVSLDRIKQGDWDFVVLQEQSQIPTIDHYRYNSMYPGVERLNDSIKKYNPCAKVVMYMTWGRRFGGQQCDPGGTYCSPVFADFTHMQDSLESAYTEIADSLGAYISPVGIAWKKIIQDTSIVLHTSDNSHPNYNGSYLAACLFHSIFWQESPIGLSFSGSLGNDRAAYLQQIADTILYHSNTDWNLNIDSVFADYSYVISNDTVDFSNLSMSQSPVSYFWDFGDGNTSTDLNPTHIYSNPQSYTVSLITSHCTKSDTVTKQINIIPSNLEDRDLNSSIKIFPNPVISNLVIELSEDYLKLEIQVINSKGESIQFFEIQNQKSLIINTNSWLKGLYLIKITDLKDSQQSIHRIAKR